jgi:hypothetical protein
MEVKFMGILLILFYLVVLYLCTVFEAFKHRTTIHCWFWGIVVTVLVSSLIIGAVIPMGHATETYKLMGVQDDTGTYYLFTNIVTQDSGTAIPQTVFVIKKDDVLSKITLDSQSIIHYQPSESPKVVFHRTYVLDDGLRALFFTHKGPTWYEFTIPNPDGVKLNLSKGG